ncbi:unnamed protein product [Staurois parvus]|uniref:Uncharacterized protein n=1 Tax=Staurois parvus TaxID=386267 RepID=A0ABN9C8E7_9NEOB|nr:unnamed protein product [Staurois parvus]
MAVDMVILDRGGGGGHGILGHMGGGGRGILGQRGGSGHGILGQRGWRWTWYTWTEVRWRVDVVYAWTEWANTANV